MLWGNVLPSGTHLLDLSLPESSAKYWTVSQICLASLDGIPSSSLSLILKYNDQHNEVLSRLGLPLFRDAKFEFTEEYVTVLHPLATALDRLQSDKECFCGCMLPTLLAVEKKLERQISNVKALLTTILRLHQASLSALKRSSTSMLRITANQPFCHWYRIHSSN